MYSKNSDYDNSITVAAIMFATVAAITLIFVGITSLDSHTSQRKQECTAYTLVDNEWVCKRECVEKVIENDIWKCVTERDAR